MTIVTLRYLYCDGPLCDEDTEPFAVDPDPNSSSADQRTIAERRGWTRRGKRDLCPECTALRTAQEAGRG